MENNNQDSSLESNPQVRSNAAYLVISAVLAYLEALNPGTRDILAESLEDLSKRFDRSDFDRASLALAIKTVQHPGAPLHLVSKD